MPIPPFNSDQVLPPHLGDPRSTQDMSPFPASSSEVCSRFATSPERKSILVGWLNFRARLAKVGIVKGFQWLDGSFVENIEKSESRSPKDVDVITYFHIPIGMTPSDLLTKLNNELPEFFDRDLAKTTFRVDHFGVNLNGPPENLVNDVRFWTGIFSHRRDRIWKGMIRVELGTDVSDSGALSSLGGAP